MEGRPVLSWLPRGLGRVTSRPNHGHLPTHHGDNTDKVHGKTEGKVGMPYLDCHVAWTDQHHVPIMAIYNVPTHYGDNDEVHGKTEGKVDLPYLDCHVAWTDQHHVPTMAIYNVPTHHGDNDEVHGKTKGKVSMPYDDSHVA